MGEGDQREELKLKGYTKEQITAFLRQKKSRVVSSLDVVFQNVENIRHPLYDFYTTLFYNYNRHNILPYPGAFVDQPAKIIEVLQIFQMLNNEREKQQLEQLNKKSKKK